MSEKVPEFVRHKWWPPFDPVPWKWHVDPPPDIYRVLKEEQLIKLVQLQVKYRQKVLEAEMEFEAELSKMLGR